MSNTPLTRSASQADKKCTISDTTNKDILDKLDMIIEQNKTIIDDNNNLRKTNSELLKTNILLKNNAEKSDKLIEELNNKIMELSSTLLKIDKNTSELCDKGSNVSLENQQNDLTKASNIAPLQHSIILSSNDNLKLSKEKWSEIASKKLSEIQINKLTLTKKGDCVIKFPNKQNKDKAEECLKGDFNVQAESKKVGLYPKVTLCDLDPELYGPKKLEKLQNDILSKNPEIQELVKTGKNFEILFIKESTQSNNQAVLKLDPEILNLINNLKKRKKTDAVIFVNNSVCRVFNRFHILQCYQCQSFGHRKGAPSCPLASTNQTTCLYCSRNHNSKDCKFKKQPDQHKCANCSRFTCSDNEDNNFCHTTTDHECPIFQKQIENVLRNTIGIEQRSKNEYAKHVFVT